MRNNDYTLHTFKRAEAKIEEEYGFSLLDRFLDSEDTPVREVLGSLVNVAMNFRDEEIDLWVIGKQLQREYGVIPFKTEYEVAAGLWQYVRDNAELLKDSPPISTKDKVDNEVS